MTTLPDTVAILVCKLVHVPPEEGVKVDVPPIQIVVEEANNVGLGFTVNGEVVFEQPVAASVKVKVTLP